MPKFRVTLSDGRIVTLEADAQPTEADVMMAIGQQSAPARQEPKIGADPNPQAPDVDAHGNRITRNPDGSVKFIQGPGFSGNADTSPDRNVATIGGFGIAPEDILTVPSLVSGAKAIGRGVSNLAGRVSMPSPEMLRRGAEIAGSPWKEATKAVLNKGAEMLERRAAPAVATKVAETVPAAAEAVVPTAAFNPTKAMHAAREAFKTAGVEPLKAEASNVMELIRRGKAPEEALAVVLKNRPAGLVQEAANVAANIKLTAEEVKFGQSLLQRGKTEKEALDAILAQRAFRQIPGTLTDAEARAALDLRNARGQIKTPSAQTAADRYPR